MAALAPALVAGMVGPHPDPDGVTRAIACMSAVPEATYRASLLLLTRFDRRADQGRIAVPTLVLAGEKDRNAAPAVMRRMAGAIPAARYVELAGCGHVMSFDQPAAFLAALVDFLPRTGEM
jgi:3-oxoadipate enol-lactonase